jgi:hypothetical protein
MSDLSDVALCADGRPSFYSHENAPGIVMAVGNTGEFLDFAADAMCTWLSRDGGATWEDVAPHAVRASFVFKFEVSQDFKLYP